MTNIIAHLGTPPHIHLSDAFAAVIITSIIYSVSVCMRQPKAVSAGRRRALREYLNIFRRK